MTSTLPILTIDLGKFYSVFCWLPPATKNADFRTVRAARDHAFTTRDTRGTPELLPRPSQQDLAKRAGLTETDVSRCLKDPAERELRLLWETALERDKVLGWKGRPHR